MMMQNWRQIGVVHVDCGLIVLTDPGWIDDRFADWDAFCEAYAAATDDYERDTWFDEDNRAVFVTSGQGDGEYPVYARWNSSGEIEEVRVVFMEDDPETPPTTPDPPGDTAPTRPTEFEW